MVTDGASEEGVMASLLLKPCFKNLFGGLSKGAILRLDPSL